MDAICTASMGLLYVTRQQFHVKVVLKYYNCARHMHVSAIVLGGIRALLLLHAIAHANNYLHKLHLNRRHYGNNTIYHMT